MGTSLTTTNNAFRYPSGAVGEAPDVPDDIRKLATDLDTFLLGSGGGTWTPGYGGAGSAIGSGGTTSGRTVRLGPMVVYGGRIVFGSGATFGSSTTAATGFNAAGVTLNGNWSMGFGWYKPNSSGTPRGVRLVPQTASEYTLLLETGTGLTAINNIGTPTTGDEIRFVLIGLGS